MDKYPKYISEEQQELFEHFLMDEMSVAEQLSFKARLADNKNLQKSFDEFKSLFEIVEETGLRDKLKDFHNLLENREKTPAKQLNPSKKWFNYRIAASITILVTMGLWFFNRPNTNERLYDKYYTQDPGLPTVMGSTDNYDFYEAMVDYKQGHYKIAIGKWEKLLTQKPENDTLNYFLGVSHIANNQFERALEFLNKNKDNASSRFFDENNFYLGMTYLKMNQMNKAKTFLEKSEMPESKEVLKSLQE